MEAMASTRMQSGAVCSEWTPNNSLFRRSWTTASAGRGTRKDPPDIAGQHLHRPIAAPNEPLLSGASVLRTPLLGTDPARRAILGRAQPEQASPQPELVVVSLLQHVLTTERRTPQLALHLLVGRPRQRTFSSDPCFTPSTRHDTTRSLVQARAATLRSPGAPHRSSVFCVPKVPRAVIGE